MNPNPSPDRRGFLKAASVLLSGVIAAIATVPVIGSALSPLLLGKKKDRGALLPAIPLDELQIGVPRRVELSGAVVDGWTRSDGVVGAAWLLKAADGTVTALSTVCPHSGCSINFAGKDTYACPCHSSAFALDGALLAGPAPRPMDRLQVEVREQQIFLRYARFKQGVKAREEL